MSEEFDDSAPDAALISLVGSAFDEGRAGHEKQDVLARGRQLRRRKRAMPGFGALGVVAVSAGLALALTGPAGAGRTAGTAVNVDKAAFSIHTDATTGKVTITFRQIFDENEVKQILANAGIRAIFASQTGCTWPGTTKLNPYDVLPMTAKQARERTFVIDPSKMPKGSVIAFDYETIGKGSIVAVSNNLLAGEPSGCGAQ